MIQKSALQCRHRLLDCAGIDGVVGAIFDDVIRWFIVFETHHDLTGGTLAIRLQAAVVHSPLPHRGANFVALGVSADAADEVRRPTEGLQVPGDIERRSAQHTLAVRKMIEQDFSKYAQALLVHACDASDANPIHAMLSG